jgi:hypothetical protein
MGPEIRKGDRQVERKAKRSLRQKNKAYFSAAQTSHPMNIVLIILYLGGSFPGVVWAGREADPLTYVPRLKMHGDIRLRGVVLS